MKDKNAKKEGKKKAVFSIKEKRAMKKIKRESKKEKDMS